MGRFLCPHDDSQRALRFDPVCPSKEVLEFTDNYLQVSFLSNR